MVDVNLIVKDILSKIDGVKITFYHPKVFNSLPVISYYELTTSTGFSYDNSEQAQMSNVVIDIWGNSGAECSMFAVEVDKHMQVNGWKRNFSRDLPPENDIYHKNMRFSKQIYF